ncbi:MAG: divalent metal cation transporter [Candidatus Eremiobacteraeota bacterium]|nr:divalent metal cation transporter [Candidatus Eremiobacteraeota bacterium]MBV8353937.1 divalent metal cation transporter [Candidatus Eremiobacteraeota bacterium]
MQPSRQRRVHQVGIGPGIIAGASDNDPTTVASLSVIGASTGYGLAWLFVPLIPMLIVVQTISAAVGAVSKRGLEDCIRARYGRGWATSAMIAVLAVNVLTLAADLEGGGAALGLLTSTSYEWWIVPLAAGIGFLLVRGKMRGIERVLRYVPLIFLAYIGAAILAHPRWADVWRATFVPHFEFNAAYVEGALALLGTTLTSYCYVWETIEISHDRPPLRRLPLVQTDAALGMIVTGVVGWFIVICTGATLGVAHQPVATAEDAARALAPIAGHYASTIFALGLLASALLALPVLAGTSAYMAAELYGWRESLDASFRRAPRFYAALLLSLGTALAICFLRVPPIKLLFLSSLLGGIATPLTLILMILIARDRSVMGRHRIGPVLWLGGWATAAIVIVATLACFVQTLSGS